MKLKLFLAVTLAGWSFGYFNIARADGLSHDTLETVAGNTAFATDLYGKLRTNSGNLFFSPYSISTALAMTYGGARAKTAEEMAQTLHFTLPEKFLHQAFFELDANLKSIEQKGQVTLAVANSLWPQKGYPFLPYYLDLCRKDYDSSAHPVDYSGNTEGARTAINDWVSEKTHGKIPELLSSGTLDPLTRLVLVNAIYFKGNWASQFQVNRTRDEAFHLSTGESVTVPMMHQTHELRYAALPGLQILELPYVGDDLSMLLLLPQKKGDLKEIESTLTSQNLALWTGQLQARSVDLFLPKFKASCEFSLGDTLRSLGMTEAFSRAADFSGMDGRNDLYISAVVHKAVVEVDEEGSEAAAATGVIMSLKAVMPAAQPTLFRADHPFLFLIRENHSGSILFLGRMTDPRK